MADASSAEAVLARLGYPDATPVGSGGEAVVYALSDDTVLRLPHVAPSRAEAERRVALLDEIAAAGDHLPFRTPEVCELLEADARFGTLERRLPGRPLDEVLRRARGPDRGPPIAGWLDAAERLPSIAIGRAGYGDLLGPHPATEPSFHRYWSERLARSLGTRPTLYADVDAAAIACALPAPERPALVHLDVFAGNLLWHEGRVAAVLDFGVATIMGDGRLDALFAAVFAASADERDAPIVREWLRERGLDAHFEAAERMVAAFWSFVDDDAPLERWCRQVLLNDTT